jgi:Dolichyl-phosphate-mannose-protein mannosyltransferase
MHGVAAPPRVDRAVSHAPMTPPSSVIGRSIAAEAAAGAVLIFASMALRGDVLLVAALVTGALLLLARTGLGAVRAGAAGAVAWGALTLLQLAVLVPGLGEAGMARVVVALAGLGTIPLVAGLLPALTVRGLTAGRREDITPALVAVAVAGGLGVLVAIAAAGQVDVGDPRLEALMPYVAAGTAVLALADVLAHHRAGAGFPETAALVAAVALGLQVVLLVHTGGAGLDDSIVAVVLASGIAAVGLLLATALATPRPLAVPAEAAAGGPRLVGWALAGLVAVAAVARLMVLRPLWIDEAAGAQRARGTVAATLDSARLAGAHPPLQDVLTWLSRHLLGADEVALRMPSLVAGILLVPALYVTGTRLYDRRVGLMAAVIGALGPGLLWLSTEARPGMLTALLATLALLAMLRAVESERPVDWVLFGAAGAALVWTHQLGFLHVAVLFAAVAAVAWRRARRGEAVERLVAGGLGALALTGAAFLALLVYRGGLGPPSVLPPLEYATEGAPGAGRSVFGLAGTALVGVVGFHPADVTSRLLALWPLGILATFALAVRTWSARGVLLATLAATPFVALLVAQIAGAPRSPLFALEWTATALPMVALGLARAAGLMGAWPRVRLVGLALAAVLVLAAVDQRIRVTPVDRVDVTPAVDDVAAQAGRDDTVVYAPGTIGDLVRHDVEGARVVRLAAADPAELAGARHVYVIGALGMADDATEDDTLALIQQLSAQRPLADESRHGETTVWSF